MPIIAACPVEQNTYRLTIVIGNGVTDNIVVSNDGIYNVYYIKNCKCITKTGRILNVIINNNIPANSYILFDWSSDQSARKERIQFRQIQMIKDVTPNNAYQIALKHGFVGTEEDWLVSMKGDPGKDAYEVAVDCGFVGTREEWLESLHGKTAYEYAVERGFEGTEEDWMAANGDTTDIKKQVDVLLKQVQWVVGMGTPST